MKYCVIIMDGAADWPLPQRQGKTCLELASIPNLNKLAAAGVTGLVNTIPRGMEPSSAIACMSVLGYDPTIYYRGRSAIEARSLGIVLRKGEVTFRCNLVHVGDGIMRSFSAGNISTQEALSLIGTLQEKLGSDNIHFYPSVSYRHILAIRGGAKALEATCIPPHDISDKPIENYLPKGPGSDVLRDLMFRSREVLINHPVNLERALRGKHPASMIWLFWGAGEIPELPSFEKRYGIRAAMTSGVDLLRGLARMAGMTVLDIAGVSDGPENDYAAQSAGAMRALEDHDLVVIHVEAPDEAGHVGDIDAKITAIEKIDREMVGPFMARRDTRVLVMPDHPTPIELKTHVPDPVPFVLWGPGFRGNGVRAYSEAEGKRTGVSVPSGYTIMNSLVGGSL